MINYTLLRYTNPQISIAITKKINNFFGKICKIKVNMCSSDEFKRFHNFSLFQYIIEYNLKYQILSNLILQGINLIHWNVLNEGKEKDW